MGFLQRSLKASLLAPFLLLAIAVLGLIGNGCAGENQLPDQVTVKLKWVHQAQFAGNYVAAEKGFYEDENLKVSIVPWSYEEQTIETVVEGKADFGIKGANEIIQARAEGIPIKALAVIYKRNPLCLYSLKESGITKPQDFVGKTVGLKPGEITMSYLIMLKKLGIDRSQITEVQLGLGVEELINGITDVSTGFSINEPHQVIEAGYDVNVILFADYGIDVYADVLFATEDTINNNPEFVEKFLRATLKGWQYAIENEEETVDIVLKYAIDRTRSHEAYMLRRSIPLIHIGDSSLGWMERRKWEYGHGILLEAGSIEKKIDIDEAFTMQFLNKIYGKGEQE